MPIPELDADGLLPAGVHGASMAEIREHFGRFKTTDRRVRLQASLEAFAAEARGCGLVGALVVDGSFTTGKAVPEDVDLVVILQPGVDLVTEFSPDQYNVISARRVKARHAIDVRYATSSPETLSPMIEFFERVRGRPELRKGMLRVTL